MKASDYRESANAAGTVSVFADVSAKSQYSTAIRTAATNSWMSGYLGGNFKPDEGLTMRDAVKAVLGVLGYTNEDFSGSLQESRLAKFKALSLDSGIRKALGAKKSVIMQQFVIEALVTSAIGGIIGIVIGAVASTGIGKLMGIEAPPTMTAVVISFSFSVSVAIGLIFGYMPASRAAKLNPIDALRTD